MLLLLWDHFIFFFFFWDVTFQLNKLPVHAAQMPQKSFPMMYCKSRTDTDLLTTFQRLTFGLQGCRWDFNSVEFSGEMLIYHQRLLLFFPYFIFFLWVVRMWGLIFCRSSWINYSIESNNYQCQYFCEIILVQGCMMVCLCYIWHLCILSPKYKSGGSSFTILISRLTPCSGETLLDLNRHIYLGVIQV